MNKIVEGILKSVPAEWKRLKEEDFALNKVYTSDAFEVVAAFEADNEIVVINSYGDVEGFVQAYDEQLTNIQKGLKGKKWQDVSTINPIKFEHLKSQDNQKVYMSVFETHNVTDKVAVQIFYEKDDKTLGFVTSVRGIEGKGFLKAVNENQTVKQILTLLKF